MTVKRLTDAQAEAVLREISNVVDVPADFTMFSIYLNTDKSGRIVGTIGCDGEGEPFRGGIMKRGEDCTG